MIKTVAELIELIKTKGLELIKEKEYVDHPTLIGDMYEGLTQQLLNKAVFDSLDLRIVNGKIKNSKGQLTNQIDCMIVEGQGEPLPFTDSHIYHFSQVIAVIEVKKNLFSNEIDSSFSNLKSVIEVSMNPEQDGDFYIIPALRDAWRAMLRMELPKRSELHTYSEDEQLIYHTLLMEAYFPIRIVIGYYGFKTEYSLRNGFFTFLKEKVDTGLTRGFGIGSLPSLIICGNNTIIKNNGMPYGMPFSQKEEFYWPICVTSNESPIIHLLEVLWTRLSYKYRISSSIFGDDFEFAHTHKFLNCKIGKDADGNIGWMYNFNLFSEKTLNKEISEIKKWEPVFLTQNQFEFVLLLTGKEFTYKITDKKLISLATSDGHTVDKFLETLIESGLVFERDDKIQLLVDVCQLTVLPDGRFCAGENKSGEFDHWLSNYFGKRENS